MSVRACVCVYLKIVNQKGVREEEGEKVEVEGEGRRSPCHTAYV